MPAPAGVKHPGSPRGPPLPATQPKMWMSSSKRCARAVSTAPESGRDGTKVSNLGGLHLTGRRPPAQTAPGLAMINALGASTAYVIIQTSQQPVEGKHVRSSLQMGKPRLGEARSPGKFSQQAMNGFPAQGKSPPAPTFSLTEEETGWDEHMVLQKALAGRLMPPSLPP